MHFTTTRVARLPTLLDRYSELKRVVKEKWEAHESLLGYAQGRDYAHGIEATIELKVGFEPSSTHCERDPM